MTAMSAPTSPPAMHGAGWRAEAFNDCIYLTIYLNATDDVLVDAVETILPKRVRRSWLVEFANEDSCGNDVYLLTQCNQT